MAIFGKFFGRTVGEGAGVAIGTATANVVEPALQELANAAREHYPFMPLEPDDAAAARAREALNGRAGLELKGVDPNHEARYGGVKQARFNVLTELAREFPSLGELLELRRRAQAEGAGAGISGEEFVGALRHAGFEYAYIDALTALLEARLSPADVANAVQQGFMPNEGLLPPATPPEPNWSAADGPFDIPGETVPIQPKTEAKTQGVTADRLKILAELVGLPPGEEALLDMWRRGIITAAGYAQGLREGHTKTKWTAALSARFFQLLPASVLVNLRLRGWMETPEYHDRMRLHGYRSAQADDWFKSAGRPMAPQQMFDAIARGAASPKAGTFSWDDFDDGIRRSDIRPEYVESYHKLYNKYPPMFQLGRAVMAGALSPERALEILHLERYEKQDAEAMVAFWSSSTQAKADPYPGRAASQLWSSLHRSYLEHETDDANAEGTLLFMGLEDAAAARVLELWRHERGLVRKTLTPAQIKRAYTKSVTNYATGAPWSRQDAVTAIVDQGYRAADVEAYLDE